MLHRIPLIKAFLYHYWGFSTRVEPCLMQKMLHNKTTCVCCKHNMSCFLYFHQQSYYCFLLFKPNPSICSVGWINLYEIIYSIHVHNLISFYTSPENWVETTHLCICIMVHLKEYAHGSLFEYVLFVYCAIASEATPWVTNHMPPLIGTRDIKYNWANSISVCRFNGTYRLLLLVWLCVVHSCTRVGTKNMSTGSESRWRHWLVQPWPRPGRGGNDTSLL